MRYDGHYQLNIMLPSLRGGGTLRAARTEGRTAMLITKVSCPHCKTVLRPAKPLPVGKKVKCPKCKTDFTAEADNGDVPADAKATPATPAAKKKAAKPPEPIAPPKKPDDDDDEDSGGTYNIIAADRPKTQEDLDREAEERGDDDEDDPNKVDFVPDHSIKDLRGPAQLAVNRPSNLLIANGVIGFFGWVILFIIMILPVVFPVVDEDEDDAAGGKDKPSKPALAIPDGLAALGNFHKQQGGSPPNQPAPNFPVPQQKKDDKKPEKKLSLYMVYVWDLRVLTMYPWYLFIVFLTPIFFGIAYAVVMTYGAVQMQNLQSRTWGIVASCMCMFPFSTWGFVTIVSMVISLVVFGLLEEQGSVLYCLVAFGTLETLGCVGIGAYGLMTMMSQEVIDGFEYVPDV